MRYKCKSYVLFPILLWPLGIFNVCINFYHHKFAEGSGTCSWVINAFRINYIIKITKHAQFHSHEDYYSHYSILPSLKC